MMKIGTGKYEGMGFVEALIAIMVVGIASVVLMQISASTLKEMIQNEVIDTMTQYAVEGAVMIQEVATKAKSTGNPDLFPQPPVIADSYYVIDSDGAGGYLFREDESGFVSYNYTTERSIIAENAAIPEQGDYAENPQFFRVFYISSYVGGGRFAIVKVIIGQTSNSDGNITSGNMVKDYTYYTVVNL